MNTNRLTGGGRAYNIDLLKIISMIMVVALHLNLFGGLITSANSSSNYLFKFAVNFYEQISIIAVNVFIIISSWFLSASPSYTLKSKRILRLLVSMFFWFIAMTGVAYALDIRPGYKELLVSVPLIGNSYSFIAGYIILFFLSPFLNRLTNQLNHNSHKKLAIILFSVFCLFAPIVANQYMKVYNGYSFMWFICIYLIVSYMRAHTQWNKKSWKWYLVVFLILTVIGTVARCFCPSSLPIYVAQGHYNDPIIFLSALSCFLLFASFTIKRQGAAKVIQFFVPLSVAVFFIHANMFVEQWFKTLEFHVFIDESTVRYMVCLPLLALAIYIVCTLCEFVREWLFDKVGINKLIDRLSLSIDKHLIF